ncbi:MAG: hypothetical protein KGY60_07950 [Bacteroidales bacterium]|nr:hypothetical protein [Bacteroidales bacterium]
MKIMNGILSKPYHWLLAIMLFLPFLSSGQIIDTFPQDSSRFIRSLSEYMEDRINKENKKELDLFIHHWETGKFNPSKRDSIVKISNVLLHNHANREPHFISMIEAMRSINGTRFDSLYFDTWMKGFEHITMMDKGMLHQLLDYFEFTMGLLESRGLNLSRTRNWYALSKDYRFVYDTTLKVIYRQTPLKCKHRNDSIQIFQTRGTYYPFKKTWQGKGGTVTWERADYSREQIHAQLNHYTIDLTKAEYQADSVLFTNNLYFDKPILGELEDKLYHVMNPRDAIYPVFRSYKKLFEIPNIYDNIDFIGGFKMKGAQFIGSGGKGQDATLKVHRNGKVFMTARAQVFILKKDKALSRKAGITIHLKNDSIYHTGLGFNYNVNAQQIELISNENILSKSVYYNTYHQVSMKFDRLLWKTNQDKIYFTHSRNASMGQATFTSMNYFTLKRWLEIEMRDRKHPLIAVRNYYNQVDSRKFDAEAFANYMRLPAHQVRQRLMYLAQDGFLFYDMDSDTVTINDKLFDYIRARIGRIDYDVIQINSSTSSPNHNAILDLSTMEMQINGVNRTFVSDSQNVVLYPDHKGLVMKENRDFDFGGVVVGGLFTFYGDSLSFSYEDFSITMKKIDSLHMRYQTDEKNQYGRKVLANVQNTVNDLTGVLHIDHPDNKSGKEDYPHYPSFEGKKMSYVYYDHLFNSPYKRENFYFELYPFTMDSLDNFNPENMKFKGTFISAGIFPPIEETLELREDNSLGFTKTTNEEGLPLYDGKGTWYQQIDMSNQGLKGQGRLTYLTAEAETEDILFFPDSTSIRTEEFTISQKTTGIQYPDVAAQKVDIQWYPHRNDMHISQTDQAFAMYQGKSTLEGYMHLTPTGLSGKGEMDMEKATLQSRHFNWEAQAFDADTSNFRLRTLSRESFAFQSDTVNASIDFTDQKGQFETVDDYSVSEFPHNLYRAYLDEFAWDMDSNRVHIESKPNPREQDPYYSLKKSDFKGALYLSTHKGQDSLRYTSPRSTFRLADTTIVSNGVKNLRIADAQIFPDEQTLSIRRQADMDTLHHARLIAGTAQQQPHEIFDAGLKVKGSNKYGGYGDYEYTGQSADNQFIHFSQIYVDDSLQTRASGNLPVKDSFRLSPFFDYSGDVHLRARRKLLRFDGNVRMVHSCNSIGRRFVQFESIIDPMDVQIPLGVKNTDRKGRKVFAGSYVTLDSSHIYSTFLTPRKDPSDDQILSSSGWLNYNPDHKTYEIASKKRLNGKETLSPYLALTRNTCQYHAEGKMNLGVDFGELKINPVGKLDHDLKTNQVKLNLTLPVKFLFSQAALDSMARDLVHDQALQTIDPQSETYRENLYRIVGESPTDNYFQALQAPDSLPGKKNDIPQAMNQSILFSNIAFTWNTSTNSYIARDDIHVAMINGKPVNKKMDGFIEIVKQKFGDKLYIYLTPDQNSYYLFYYFRGMMRTTSSNRKFVKAIEEVPNRKRDIKEGLTNTVYRYLLSTQTSFARFKKHMNDVLKEIASGEQAQQPSREEEASSPKQDTPESNDRRE